MVELCLEKRKVEMLIDYFSKHFGDNERFLNALKDGCKALSDDSVPPKREVLVTIEEYDVEFIISVLLNAAKAYDSYVELRF